VAFADDDSWWHPGALAAAAEVFAVHRRLGLLAARIVVGEDGAPDPLCEQMAAAPLGTSSDLPGPDVLGFVACAAVVRRQAFLSVGGFDDVVFFAGEEERVALDLAAAGWGLAYVDGVTAHHQPSSSRASPSTRQALIERNHVLTAVMRRPWRVVRQRVADRTQPWAGGRSSTAARTARALRRRHRLPTAVEARAAVLDDVSAGRFEAPGLGSSRS